ncbi:hypothetical protein [Bacteroides caecigallinarum]|uniref:hypothetical protein n=1 Tax=Bacteroides caecigallinarum TaxID=1411144 RepID=UPI00195D4D06|nr:hypothetical protein [Bacteroides caecigallinarum]MBM6881752.1 hypothetical protein [Bacteroides caecigallinarum]MDN0072652.1 hypothetical protein [Bacteroides caecigallinarum]
MNEDDILNENEYLYEVGKIRDRILKEPICNCMCPQCANRPIFSHVFQKEGVLREISINGKVMAFSYKNLFETKNNRTPVFYKEVGIHETFGFYGFCKKHDNSLFAPIEPVNKQVDWYNENNQYLLAYRTLCREYYIQMVVKSVFKKCLDRFILPENILMHFTQEISNCDLTIKVFDQYKLLLEKGINDKNFSQYKFKVIELPFRLELCLASPINITEECKGLCWRLEDKIVDTINIVNIFPYKNRTIVIIGFLQGEKNRWASDIFQKLRGDNLEDVCIALQDIIFRSEFHCMSKTLYDEIKSEIPLFLDEWTYLMRNHNFTLCYNSNIFRKYIFKLLGYTDEIV